MGNYEEFMGLTDPDGYELHMTQSSLNGFEMGGLFSKIKKLHKKIHKKLTPKPIQKLENKIKNNPKIIKVISTVGAVVATIYAGPTAGQAILAAGNKLAADVEFKNQAKKVEAYNKTVAAVQEKIKDLPPENQQIIADAFAKEGVKALEQPKIKQLMMPALQAGTVALSTVIETDAGKAPNVASENAKKIGEMVPEIVKENDGKIFGVDRKLIIYSAAGVLGVVLLSLFMRRS